VVVRLKSGHCDPSEVKNIVYNLLHLAFSKPVVIYYTVVYELNHPIKDDLRQRIFPNY
jgi:hypothetical protein